MFDLENKHCYECEKWEYNSVIERKYGEGTGLCDSIPKGCDRAACLCFVPNKALGGFDYEK